MKNRFFIIIIYIIAIGTVFYIVANLALPRQNVESSQNIPPQPPKLEENPDPQDNLNNGPVNDSGNRLYRNGGLSFELEYPSIFEADRWLLVPDTKPGALYKVGIKFTGTIRGGNVEISVLATRLKDDFGLCSTCDPRPEDIVYGTLDGEAAEFIPSMHYARTERNGIHYSFRVFDQGGTNKDGLDSLFKAITQSFKFLK